MKQGHLLLIFLILYGSCFLGLYCEQKRYDRIMEEKYKTEQGLLQAIEFTAAKYREVIKDNEEKKKQVISEAFSEAFYCSMGFSGTDRTEEFWRLYIPMLVLVEEDGAEFYYVEEKTENGYSVLTHEWSEKIKFEIPEESSEAKKVSLLADILEERASQIISDHNRIAKQYGITYRYSLPLFFRDTSKPLEFPVLLVVFQGWPLDSTGTVFYENCLDAGVFLRQKMEK